MNTVLVIKSSLNSEAGESSRLADLFVSTWREHHPDGEIIVRDLARDPVPHLTAERFGAFLAQPETRTAGQQAIVEESDALIAELQRADTIVLALPLYNFGVPSTLKAYFDHIARAGVTFRYTESGSEGLLKGKKTYVFAARGGVYSGTPNDHQTPYIRQFLAFLGLSDIEFVVAEGLALGDASRKAGLARARTALAALSEETLPLAA